MAFCDAWRKGVRNFDVASFYQSALKDASVVSPLAGTGRKGLQRSIFNGYTDTGVDEGLSWSMDGYINDFAIGNLADAPATQHAANDPYAKYYAGDARYYRNRGLGYVNLFDADVGFFVGRAANGQWRDGKADFDPIRWGGDYTETDAWNMASHAPQDGAGLAALYGGRAGLAAKLDALFATRGTSTSAATASRYTRCSRRATCATCAWASTATATNRRTTSCTCTTSPASHGRRKTKCVMRCRVSTSAARSARAIRVTRTTARCRPGMCSVPPASIRCAWARPST